MKKLSAENISFSYHGGRAVFHDFSLEIHEGEMVVLAGCNGCGKSTLLRLFSGMFPPSSGKILLNNRRIQDYSASERARILGFVPQGDPSAFGLTVWELVLIGRTGYLNLPVPSSRDRAAVEKALADTDMTSLAMRRCSELSGGELRRAAIAAVLAQEPEILLLDEPCASLDFLHGDLLMRSLQKMRRERNMTVVMVSHDLTSSARYAANAVLMKEGRVIAQGHPEKVFTEDNLSAAYGCRFQILHDHAGQIVFSLCSAVNEPEK